MCSYKLVARIFLVVYNRLHAEKSPTRCLCPLVAQQVDACQAHWSGCCHRRRSEVLDRPRLSRFTDIKRSFVGSERGASPRNCYICISFVAGFCGVHNTGDRQVPPVGRTNWSVFFSVLLKSVKNRSAFKISWSASEMYT